MQYECHGRMSEHLPSYMSELLTPYVAIEYNYTHQNDGRESTRTTRVGLIPARRQIADSNVPYGRPNGVRRSTRVPAPRLTEVVR